jgi:hypothetical protein
MGILNQTQSDILNQKYWFFSPAANNNGNWLLRGNISLA